MSLKFQLNQLPEQNEAEFTERFRQQLWERMFFWSLDNIDHSFSGAVHCATVALSAFDKQFKDDRR